MHRLIALSIASLFVFSASTAQAIDGYKDRHGFFIGGGIGGGPGSVYVGDENLDTGLEGTGTLGLAPHLVVGGGMNDNVLFGAEMNNWIRTVNVHGNRLNHQHWSFNAITNLFVVHGLYVEGGLGLAYGYSQASPAEGEPTTYGEMGLSGKIGAGFEYFLDGTIAAGMSFGYTRHFYSNVDFDTFTGKVTLRWY